MSGESEENNASPNSTQVCCLTLIKSGHHKTVGAVLKIRLNRLSLDDSILWKYVLYDFHENDRYTNLDCFLNQLDPSCQLLLSDDFPDTNDGKKILRLIQEYSFSSVTYCKKASFRSAGSAEMIDKLIGVRNYSSNSAQIERPHGLSCFMCLCHHFQLSLHDEYLQHGVMTYGSLSQYMRLDSAAANAINLFPKSDDPSPYGSLYGLLNRCKTKMGQRLLESWLRHPLLDLDEINHRLDIVEILTKSVLGRNRLVDGSLKGIPDVDLLLSKIQRPNCDLETIYRIYLFTRSFVKITSALEELVSEFANDPSGATSHLIEKYLRPLHDIDSKFELYRELVEHVIDMDRLPEVVISAKHDPELAELDEERCDIEAAAKKLQDQANQSWGSFTDVKLEFNSQWGFIFRTTKGDDEREIRKNNPKVQILSLQKNGLHFTTPQLSELADRHRDIESQYKKQQLELVKSAVNTAKTYLPIIEAACTLISELDVLSSFATIAALSSAIYSRPELLPLSPVTVPVTATGETTGTEAAGSVSGMTEVEPTLPKRVMNLVGARHPCVELMDNVEFIPNNYQLETNSSNFQIITGPNMGGKSTYIRAIGSIVCLAQVGCFVPAQAATISLVDSILARVGAGDATQKGISTFMAEMLEASVLLETASFNSLIIIDELGRGTSTFDGFGIAWAIAEFISTKINCFCFFATHFHEITALEKHHRNIKNVHVSALIQNKDVLMLHQVLDGPCLESFGIPVAAMAGFPESVLIEAKRKFDCLEDPEGFGLPKDDPQKLQKIQDLMGRFEAIPFDNLPRHEGGLRISEIRQEIRGIDTSPAPVAAAVASL